jgi:nucleoside-diphosphate-sugar epimerase
MSLLPNMIIQSSATIRDAIEAINANGMRGVFVCDDDNELAGMIMDAEIRRLVLKDIDLNRSVKTTMNTDPFWVSANLSERERNRQAVASGKLLVPVLDEARKVVDSIYVFDHMTLDPAKAANGNRLSAGVFPPSKVLVIGGAGYIGSVLMNRLLRLGHEVVCLDMLLYGKEPIAPLMDNPNFSFLRGDCRSEDMLRKAAENVDAVVHLGEIVGDPACKIDEDFTIETNFLATSKVIELCAREGIPRFVFTSSCSVYGQSDEVTDETSELNPVSLYARCKIECERAILETGAPNTRSTILRLGTVHGMSPRQRFDLVVNLLSIKAMVDGTIDIFGGNQWRPFISVDDVCRGIITVLHSNQDLVAGQIFNLGDSRENYTISDVGEIIKRLAPETEVNTRADLDDPRNYRVSFDKIRNSLGFTSEQTVEDTVRAIAKTQMNGQGFTDYDHPRYHNVRTLG